jgi:hypothetical protein
MKLRKSFYEVAEADPAMATAMFHAALKRLGGSLCLTQEELEAYEGVGSAKALVAGEMTEEPDIAHVEWTAAVFQFTKPEGAA